MEALKREIKKSLERVNIKALMGSSTEDCDETLRDNMQRRA